LWEADDSPPLRIDVKIFFCNCDKYIDIVQKLVYNDIEGII